MFGRRRRDERAWRTWGELTTQRRAPGQMVGQVSHVYQHAKRGSKAIVDFGPGLGRLDTWWPGSRPKLGQWVLVRAHRWTPPGTHSGTYVWWIDGVDGIWPADLRTRAERFAKRRVAGRT